MTTAGILAILLSAAQPAASEPPTLEATWVVRPIPESGVPESRGSIRVPVIETTPGCLERFELSGADLVVTMTARADEGALSIEASAVVTFSFLKTAPGADPVPTIQIVSGSGADARRLTFPVGETDAVRAPEWAEAGGSFAASFSSGDLTIPKAWTRVTVRCDATRVARKYMHVPVAPGEPDRIVRTRKALREAFATPDGVRGADLFAGAVSIGPRLWASTTATRQSVEGGMKDGYAVVQPGPIVEEWRLQALDLPSLPEPLRGIVERMAASGGTPVTFGTVHDRVRETVSTLVAAVASDGEYPFEVRRPTDRELEYYYAIIPYELSEPIWVLEGATRRFLCDFDESGHLFYLEAL